MRLIADGKSPFSGNESLFKEYHEPSNDSMIICIDTGYHTYEKSWKKDNEDVLARVEESLPMSSVQQKRIVDDQVWYKIVLMTAFVIITPEQYDDRNVWSVYTFKDGDPSTEVTFPMETVTGEVIHRTPDNETRKEFQENEFNKAWDYFQLVNNGVTTKIMEEVGLNKED